MDGVSNMLLCVPDGDDTEARHKSHDKEYPLFGSRHDQAETLRFNLMRPIGACWSLNFGWVFTGTRSTINIYKRSANNLSAQVNYQCFK